MKTQKQNPSDKLEHWPIDKLIPYARNSRTHSDAQVAQIAASIREWGWTTPVLVDSNGTIIAGHGRVMAARKLGIDKIPVVIADGWTDAQKRAYVIADNKLALNAGWDADLLGQEFAELADVGFDLDLTGFTAEEIDALKPVEVTAGLTDEDAVPEAPAEPVTKPGDVWVMGKHRLMCGDSTSIDAVDTLMAGQKADICFTSPPYALGNSISLSGNKAMKKKDSAYDSHKDKSADWPDLMDGWWNASLTAVESGWVVNVQPLAGNKRELMKWINDRIDRLADIATWDKGHAAPQMAKGVMASRYEWMVIFGKPDASRSIPCSDWRGTIQSVYEAPPQRKNDFSSVHAATMPVHVPLFVLEKLCNAANSVYEPFCGTGTTLIAAEKLAKRGYAMELSPQYCDVIVKRWQDFTGKQAVLEATGKPFAEVASV